MALPDSISERKSLALVLKKYYHPMRIQSIRTENRHFKAEAAGAGSGPRLQVRYK